MDEGRPFSSSVIVLHAPDDLVKDAPMQPPAANLGIATVALTVVTDLRLSIRCGSTRFQSYCGASDRSPRSGRGVGSSHGVNGSHAEWPLPTPERAARALRSGRPVWRNRTSVAH